LSRFYRLQQLGCLHLSSCHAAEVELDPETATMSLQRYTAIDDYGRLINPMLTIGQVQGRTRAGHRLALFERTVYDESSGQLLSGSFTDYALPRADDLPSLDIICAEPPTATNPLGVKGAGQAGCIAKPQTISDATLDALTCISFAATECAGAKCRQERAIVIFPPATRHRPNRR
jgi:aerobic carbon-monoxide dehydrogenase large subunit